MDLPTFASSLLARSESLLSEWYPNGKVLGREFVIGNIQGDAGKSLSINLETGVFVDFADPDIKGGDLVALYAAKCGLKQGEAAKQLGWANGAIKPPDRACEPIPTDPPRLPGAEPAAVYKYGSAFWIARHETPEGKTFKPWTWRLGRWVAKAYPAPRPLYGLELLSDDKPVLIVEGEKCAEAGRAALGRAYSVLTWAGGAHGVASTDWAPLYGRQVDLWPDADEAGAKAVAAILERLAPHIIKRVRVLEQTGQPPGWDIADAIAGGWGLAELAAHVNREGGKYIKVIEPISHVGRVHDGVAPVAVIEPPGTMGERSVRSVIEELGLKANSGGIPHPTVSNLSLVIQRHPELAGKVWFDTFRQQIRTTFGGPEREWTDADDLAMTFWLQQRMDFHKAGTVLVQQAIEHAAHSRAINSVTTWLNGLEWDQERRLDTWLSDCLGVAVDPYSSAIGRNWLISMVARAFNPGCQADHMPVLEGKMGTGKSTFLAVLGDPWFSALPEAFGSKDFFQAIQGQWLIEVPDMTGFSKRDHSHIIAVITTRTDRYRASYGRRTENHLRQCIFTATSESDDYLQDSRGIRRYWPLRCQSIDIEALQGMREQLFAEAVVAFKAGAMWYEMPESSLGEQFDRRNEDPWREQVLTYCRARIECTSVDILMDCIQMKLDAVTPTHKNRIAVIMREDNWRQFVATRRGIRMRVWTKEPHFKRSADVADPTDKDF